MMMVLYAAICLYAYVTMWLYVYIFMRCDDNSKCGYMFRRLAIMMVWSNAIMSRCRRCTAMVFVICMGVSIGACVAILL